MFSNFRTYLELGLRILQNLLCRTQNISEARSQKSEELEDQNFEFMCLTATLLSCCQIDRNLGLISQVTRDKT